MEAVVRMTNSKISLEEFSMIKSYKILSLLLSYPNAELQAFLGEALTELRNEALLPVKNINEISIFLSHFKKLDLTEWQAEYVQLFDYSRSASLHLFEHLKGDSRDRGQAMVDLIEFYNKDGFYLSGNELPDYLPVFLEFLSTRNKHIAAELLAEPVNVINRIYLALKEKDQLYQYVLSAVISLSAKKPDKTETELLIRKQKPLDLDAEYQDDPVVFGNQNSFKNCK